MEHKQSAEWNELFIGRDDDLRWLHRLWTEAKSGEPRFCVLRGESGFGKTKIIQKFYSNLSTSPLDDPNHYWPDTLLKEQNNLRINPRPIDFSETNTIPWLWWGIRWINPDDRNLSETQSCVLLANLDHLKPHQDSILAFQQSKNRLGNIATKGAELAVDVATLGIFSVFKTGIEIGKTAFEELKSHDQQQLSIEEQQHLELASRLEKLMDFFVQILAAKAAQSTELPLILVLDDSQWIDAPSQAFIKQLMLTALEKNWPLLVIATHWEQEWNLSDSEYSRDKLPALYQQLTAVDQDCCSLRDIDRLKGLTTLVKTAFPGLTDSQITFLSERADGNPRLLYEIILELIDEPYYFEQQNNQLALTDDALQEMHNKSFALHEVQTRRFKRMHQSLQTLLSYASYQGMHFIKDLVIELAENLDQQQKSQPPQQTMASAIHPYATIIESSTIIYEFRHRVFYDLAKARVDKFATLKKHISEGLLSIGCQWLKDKKHLTLSEDEKETFYLLMLKLLDSQNEENNVKWQVLSELLLLYQQQAIFVKALPWLDLLDDCFSEIIADSNTVLDFWTQYYLINLLRQLNQWTFAERLANWQLKCLHLNLESLPGNKDYQRELMVIQNILGDINVAQDRNNEALTMYQTSLSTAEGLIECYGETTERLRDLSLSQDNVAKTLKQQDQINQSLTLYQASLSIRHGLIDRYGETAERLRDLSASQDNVASILTQQDQLEQALTLYQTSFTTRNGLIDRYGETSEWLRDLSLSQDNVAHILELQDQLAPALILSQSSLSTREGLIERYGETAERLRDMSVSQDNVASILTQQDQLEQALTLYQTSLTTREGLIERYGETAERLRDLSVSQERVAQILEQQDQLEQALALYQASLTTAEGLIEHYGETAERLRDTSVFQNKVAHILKQQDQLDPALSLYQVSLSTREGLIERYGETAERLRDLSASQNNIAQILEQQDQLEQALALYQASLTTREGLIERYGETTERLHDLSASQDTVASILTQQDQLEQALALYQASLSTRERLIERYGETAERLRDLSASQDNVASILTQQDQLEQALTLYQASLTTREGLIERYGETAERLRNMSVSQINVASILKQQNQLDQALTLYQASLSTAEGLIERYGETAERLRDIFVSYYCCACCYSEGVLENAELLNKALLFNQKRMLTYPQYSKQTIAEQEQLIEIFKTSLGKLGNQLYLDQVSEFESVLESFKQNLSL